MLETVVAAPEKTTALVASATWILGPTIEILAASPLALRLMLRT